MIKKIRTAFVEFEADVGGCEWWGDLYEKLKSTVKEGGKIPIKLIIENLVSDEPCIFSIDFNRRIPIGEYVVDDIEGNYVHVVGHGWVNLGWDYR